MGDKGKNMTKKTSLQKTAILWTASGILLLGLLFARLVYPEYLWLTIAVATLLIGALAGLIQLNRQALKSRSAAYGINSLITALLVIGIVGVVDFLSSRYPYKIDLTKNKIHTLSDQTIKLLKNLKSPVRATLFAKTGQREQVRPILENYKTLSSKFELEFVDPDREPTRAKAAGIKKYGTLHLQAGTRESSVDEMTEEKITNAMIKLTHDKVPTLCAIVGHGEKSFDSQEQDGYATMKKSLADQSYDVKEINLLQEGKLPENCDALAIIGPTKAFFPPEVKLISDYLASGGRALIALDINTKGAEFAPELIEILKGWYVRANPAMIIDPISRQFGVDASAPVAATYSKENPIVRDFSLQNISVFPFLRPFEIMQGSPAGLVLTHLVQTTPKSIQVTDLKQVAAGAIAVDPTKNKMGPFDAVVAVEGKQQDSKAARKTRLVLFGSSNFANNNYARYGSNSDLFLNSVAWVADDENMISIHARDDGASKFEMSQKQGIVIALVTILALPALVAAAGIAVWVMRRRM